MYATGFLFARTWRRWLQGSSLRGTPKSRCAWVFGSQAWCQNLQLGEVDCTSDFTWPCAILHGWMAMKNMMMKKKMTFPISFRYQSFRLYANYHYFESQNTKGIMLGVTIIRRYRFLLQLWLGASATLTWQGQCWGRASFEWLLARNSMFSCVEHGSKHTQLHWRPVFNNEHQTLISKPIGIFRRYLKIGDFDHYYHNSTSTTRLTHQGLARGSSARCDQKATSTLAIRGWQDVASRRSAHEPWLEK